MASFDGTRAQAPDTPDAAPLQVNPFSSLDFNQGAARPVEDNRLGQLAQSLGAFNSDLGSFGDAYSRAQRVHVGAQNAVEVQGAQNLIASKTPEEWQQAVKAGTLPRFQSPMAQLAVDRTTGLYAGRQLGLQVEQKVGTGELSWSDGSAEKFLSDQRDQTLQQNGWEPTTGQARGFGDAFNSIWQNAQGKIVQASIADTNAAHNDAAYKQLEMAADHAQTTAMSPEQSVDLFNQIKSGLMQTMHFEPKELDPILMQVLGRRVAQDPNWAVGVATAQRPDATGVGGTLPALADNPAYATTVDRWKTQQQAFNADAAKTSLQQQVAGADLQSLLRGDGSFNSIEDRTLRNPVNGTDIDLKAKARQSAAVDQYEAASRQQAVTNRETPLQTFQREAPVFIDNDVKRDAWVRQIEGSVALANNTNLTNPADVQRLVSAGQTYAQLQAMSPAYVREHFSERSRQFFDTYQVLKQYATTADGKPMNDTLAMNAAADGIRPDTPEQDSYKAAQVQEAKAKVGGLADPNGWWASTGGRIFGQNVATATNVGQLQSELMRLSTALAKSGGLDGTTAVDKAAEMLAKTSSVRNGQWMPNENLLGAGDDGTAFKAVSDRVAQQYADGPGKQVGLDAHQVTLKAEGSGYYRLTDSNGLPIPGGPRLSRGDLIGQLKAVQAEQESAVLAKQKATAAEAVQRRSSGETGSNFLIDPDVDGQP